MDIQTHPAIDRELSGDPIALGPGTATVRLHTLPRMAADDRGLVHGGFVFGAADYAAMLAVNDPLVVLGAVSLRFVAPVAVGEDVVIVAERVEERGKRHKLQITARVSEREVMTGTMTAYVVDKHVLDT